jgi:hypothetical protein
MVLAYLLLNVCLNMEEWELVIFCTMDEKQWEFPLDHHWMTWRTVGFSKH